MARKVTVLPTETVHIDKLVHGGQGIGTMADGRKCFVWGVLPDETAVVQLTKRKKDWAEGYAVEILQPNPDRVEPREPDMFLATSPWQIIDFAAEARLKQAILAETFTREGVTTQWLEFYQHSGHDFGYRNKMEYNFWFDTETERVSLALHRRGSHQKLSVAGSALATDHINAAGQALVDYINTKHIEGRPLKSVILRSDQSGMVGLSLFMNDPAIADAFADFTLPQTMVELVYSNPKSPASVATEVLKSADISLVDTLLGRDFRYSTRSFFQVNIPVYESVLAKIAQEVVACDVPHVIDLYSGVGSIGLSVVSEHQKLTMIETSQESTDQAALNMVGRPNCSVVTATAESALDHIREDAVVIVDPPRAGLHTDVTTKLVQVKPPKIIYLSCNPSTQARDIKQLVDGGYNVASAQGFNFFPHTPHIESCVVLNRAS